MSYEPCPFTRIGQLSVRKEVPHRAKSFRAQVAENKQSRPQQSDTLFGACESRSPYRRTPEESRE
jgi:hypothetical protein